MSTSPLPSRPTAGLASPQPHVVVRYALPFAAVGVAVVLTRVLASIGDSGISPLFFAAVLVSAWYGGVGPGLLATLLSGIATAYLLLLQRGASVAAIQDHVLRLVVFTVVSILAGALHAATRRAADASARAREAAESASRAKSQFLAMVSHELRTPLSPVLLTAEMLEQDPLLPAQLLPEIQSIRRYVGLEVRLIEDLVDLTRISAGKMSLRAEYVDVHDVLRAAVEVCRADADEKRLRLTTNLNADARHVVGDPVRLQQVFWNLLRNAIKFTPDGGTVAVTTRDADAGHVEVAVADNGIGIDRSKLSVIFNAFEQGEPDVQVRFGGLGLGLAICQALVAAHGGTVGVASEGKGRGATFTVRLPLAKGPQPVQELPHRGGTASLLAAAPASTAR